MAPRPARALEQLRAQINAIYPRRGKSADGWVGDTAHAARRSDHKAQEAQAAEVMKAAKAQESLANQKQNDLQEKLDELLARMDDMPGPRR